MMSRARVGIIGASGYSGMELTRILFGHSRVEVAFVTSDRWVDQTVESKLGDSSTHAAGRYSSVEQGLEKAGECEVVFLATPAETSLELAPKLLTRTRVVDLAGTFRLRDAGLYPTFYKFTHPDPTLLARWAYGMPELFRERIAGQRFIANPGCYATATALSVAPLVREGLVDLDSIVFNAASGVSGAGRRVAEEYGFMEVDSDFRAYKVLSHQHTPEIEQTLSAVAQKPVSVVFTPHLLPMKRGILSTAVLTLREGVTASAVAHAYQSAYGSERLLRLMPAAEAVRIAEVVNTPHTHIGVTVKGRRCVAISALDNLQKGAASQAVQNMNLMLGFPETEGLL